MEGEVWVLIGVCSPGLRTPNTGYLRVNTQPLLWTCKPFNELSVTELYGILHLRNEVFIMEQNCPYQDCDFKDMKSWHLMGTEEGRLLGYTRLLPQGVSYAEASIGRVVTSPLARKTGLGRVLMQESITRVATLFNAREIRIGAQLYLKHFYESLGFEQQGDGYLEDGIPHIIMLLKRSAAAVFPEWE